MLKEKEEFDNCMNGSIGYSAIHVVDKDLSRFEQILFVKCQNIRKLLLLLLF